MTVLESGGTKVLPKIGYIFKTNAFDLELRLGLEFEE